MPPELIKELIGAKGIGTHYLCEEVGPEVDPLSPSNKLIFVIGPMAGTTMFGSNRYALYFVSPLTGGYCECYSGGNLTPQFAAHRLQGRHRRGQGRRARLPRDQRGGRRLPRADDLWGLDAFEAEDKIARAHRRTRRPRPA